MSTCKSCGAEVIWKVTEGGKKTPIDAEPCEDGNLFFFGSGAHPVSMIKPGLKFDGPRYKSHFATCPNAKQHRKPKS